MLKRSFEAIGTHWEIEIETKLNQLESEKLHQEIAELIEDFDQAYSRFRPDSLVTAMAKQAGKYTLRKDFLPLLQLYQQLYQLSSGLFTPLVGQLLAEAGYDANYSLQSKKLSSIEPLEQVLSFDQEKIELQKAALLDFGAAGKGYLVDLVAELLAKKGLSNYTINAGGDIRRSNNQREKIHIGLENPHDQRQAIGLFELGQGSICGSATNRRAWGNFHHIMNPKQLSSVTEISSTWAIVESKAQHPTMLADALATCMFLVEPELLRKKFDFAYVIYKTDGTVKLSDNFTGTIFYEK